MEQQRYPSKPPEIQVRVDLRPERDCSRSSGRTVVHPVSITPPLFTTLGGLPLVNKQVMHFKKWFPWLIPAFVIANVVVFIVTMYINDCHTRCLGRFLGRFSFQNFQDNPLLGPSSITLQKMGALDRRKMVDEHQGWRLITSMWLHGGVFHLLVNMVGLLVIGIQLEVEFGFVRIGMLYVISGFGGAILSSLFLQISISVGASGAVFGLLGAMLSELITNWTIYDNELSWFITLVGIIIINLALGVLPHVDNFAHIGGFITGFLLGFVFLIRPQFKWITQKQAPAESSSAHGKPKYKTYQCILWVLSLILLVVGIVIGLVSLIQGFDANKYCYWCHYLTCVPTSNWKCGNPPIFCSSNQNRDQLNITCSSNGKSAIYLLPDATFLQIERLCSVVCN